MPIVLEVTEALQILNDYESIFTASNPALYIVRMLGWLLLKFVKWVLDSVLSVLTSAFDVLNFSKSAEASKFLNTYQDVLFPLMALTLLVIGILFIVGSDQIKGSKVLQNIALGVSVLIILPTLTMWLNNLTLSYAGVEKSAMEKGVDDILAQNTYDLQYIFQDDDYGDRYNQKNNFLATDTTDRIWQIDINEQIIANDDDVNAGPNDVFAKTYDPAYPDIEKDIKPTKVIAQIDFLTNWYYRYSVDMVSVMLIYVVYCVVIISTIFKCVRLAYEIVVHQLLAMFLAVTDMATGRRIRTVLSSLLASYIVLMYAITAIVLFNIFTQWILAQPFGTFESAIFIAAVAMAVLDGPVIIQRIFGIDAGIRSGFSVLLAGWAGTKAIGHTAKRAGSAISKVSRKQGEASKNAAAAGENKNNRYGANHKENGQHTIQSESVHPGTAAIPNQGTGQRTNNRDVANPPQSSTFDNAGASQESKDRADHADMPGGEKGAAPIKEHGSQTTSSAASISGDNQPGTEASSTIFNEQAAMPGEDAATTASAKELSSQATSSAVAAAEDNQPDTKPSSTISNGQAAMPGEDAAAAPAKELSSQITPSPTSAAGDSQPNIEPISTVSNDQATTPGSEGAAIASTKELSSQTTSPAASAEIESSPGTSAVNQQGSVTTNGQIESPGSKAVITRAHVTEPKQEVIKPTTGTTGTVKHVESSAVTNNKQRRSTVLNKENVEEKESAIKKVTRTRSKAAASRERAPRKTRNERKEEKKKDDL